MRIGILDLDTSHPAAWLPVERALGLEIVGVHDGGAVHPPGHAACFAAEHGIPRVFPTPEAMLAEVDAVVLHGCDWDLHIAKARPFVEAGKTVLIDKPLAGNLADLRQLRRWVEGGARIYGGSTLRHARELSEWQSLPETVRGAPHTLLSGCAVDDFNYGIHAYTLISAAMGPGARQVRHLGDGPQQRVEVRWADGRLGWVTTGAQAGGWMPFHATILTEQGVVQMQPATGDLYRAFLERIHPWLTGAEPNPPCAFDAWIEPELLALAALQSRQNGGVEVRLSEIHEHTRHDGAAFAESYRRARYGPGDAR